MVWSAENLVPIGVVTWLGSRRVSPDAREWLSQGVAAVHTGNGGGTHRSCMEPARSADVPRAAVATDADGLKQRRQLTIAAVNGSGVLRWRPSRCDEGLKTGSESG